MHGLSDGTQAKTFYIDFAERDPETGICIVGSLNHYIVFHVAEIEHIECMDVHARVFINVRNRKEILHFFDAESCLFLDFPDDTLFTRFPVINETAREVKGSLCRLLTSTDNK